MSKSIAVGRVDGQLMPPEVAGLNRAVKRRWFGTVEQATTFIGQIAKHDPKGVEEGKYYLDAPESVATSQKSSASGPSHRSIYRKIT